MTRLLDIIGLCAILLISAFPNAAWPATPSPAPKYQCWRDAFSDDGVVPEQPVPCVRTIVKPTHVPSPLPYVILCPKDTRRCSVYKLHNGAYEWIQTATPLPGVSP